MVFPGDTKNKRYSDALTAFLKRDAEKDSIKQYTELLLGSHSTRKGATNAGAQGGLVAGVLMAVLLRGQWDIGDTLKRYFKENNSGDALVSRIVAGLDIYCSTSKEVKELSIIIITMKSVIIFFLVLLYGTRQPCSRSSSDCSTQSTYTTLYD